MFQQIRIYMECNLLKGYLFYLQKSKQTEVLDKKKEK